MATLIQTKPGTASGSNTSLGITWDSNTTTGDFIIVCIACTSIALNGVSSVTDSQGNGYFRADSFTYVDDAAGTDDVECWIAFNIAGGTTPTITIAHASSSISAVAREYSGVLPVTPNVGHSTGTGTAAAATKIISSTRVGDLIIGYASDGFGSLQTYTAGTGFTNATNQVSSGINMAMEEKVLTAAFAGKASLTLGNSTKWGAGVIQLRGLPSGSVSNALRPHIFSPGLAR